MDTNINELYDFFMISQIQNDTKTLINLRCIMSNPILSLSMLPFYALFAEEVNNVIGHYQEVHSITDNTNYSVTNVRLKLKLFSGNRLKKEKERVSKINDIQDESYGNAMRFKFLKYLNVHDNLGIYFNDKGRIIGNTQYYFHMFQDKKLKRSDLIGSEVKAFGEVLGRVMGSVDYMFAQHGIIQDVIVNNKNVVIKYKDYNTNRKKFIDKANLINGKDLYLILLHTLTSINFVRFILDEVLENQNTYLLRIKYITLYYSFMTIDKITKSSTNENIANIGFDNLRQVLVETLPYINSEFRSCLMHYRFENKVEYMIDEKYLDVNKKFYGLIETHFNGISYSELFEAVSDKLDTFSDIIERILDIDKGNLKKL